MNENALCTKTHEYVLDLGNNTFETGITDYEIEQLGDIVFIELPEVGSEFVKNEVFATVESVKAASEIYMPVSGKIIEINDEVVNQPERLNDENYNDKWLVKFESEADQLEFADLMDYSDYKEELL
ncbi:MAG: glycine cleavage system protein GcvH [bacterium]|nr:glycine cleavage system protein GcvH [bacterium]